MLFDPKQARFLLRRVDPGQVRSGLAVGLRDGAILALIAAGLSSAEIAGLRGSAVKMERGSVVVTVRRTHGTWSAVLAVDLGARLLAWLAETRAWDLPEPIFRGHHRPLAALGICRIFGRYCAMLSNDRHRPRPDRRNSDVHRSQRGISPSPASRSTPDASRPSGGIAR